MAKVIPDPGPPETYIYKVCAWAYFTPDRILKETMPDLPICFTTKEKAEKYMADTGGEARGLDMFVGICEIPVY